MAYYAKLHTWSFHIWYQTKLSFSVKNVLVRQQFSVFCVYFFSFLPVLVHQWVTLSESVLFSVPDITCWYWYHVLLFVYLQPPSGHRWNPVGQVEAAASGQPILCAVFRHWVGFYGSALCWEGYLSHQGGVYNIFFSTIFILTCQVQ